MNSRILIVDDNALNRKLASELLEIEGYEISTCDDAEEVLQCLAGAGLPDLILMDISLPGMDGLTLTRQLRSEPRMAGVVIVALTAFAMKGDEQKALDAGCDGYITKPIDTRQLPRQVAMYLADGKHKEQQRLNVMVVEDHRIDLKLAGDRIRLSGHVALDNCTAEQAIENLERDHPDVILLDLNLPGMDGLDFVRRVKGDPRTCELPIVAITAFPDDFRRERLMAAGCAAFLVKPVVMGDLLRQIENAAQCKR